MKRKHLFVFSVLFSLLLVASASFFITKKVEEKKLNQGDYISSIDSYYGGTLDNPAASLKASKLITPTDSYYNTQKNYSHSSSLLGDIESTWSSFTGKGTTIAIIDDGFDYNHPEYTRSDGTHAILSTSRYYYAVGNTYYYKEYSSDPTCIAEDWKADSNSNYSWQTHGTNTSTTAAAPMNNGGVVGIAPEADILAIKMDFSFAAIYGAIEYAISQNVDVINMSIGAYAEVFTDGLGNIQNNGYTDYQVSSIATVLNPMTQAAHNAGIIVVAAAGNHATYHKSYPACSDYVIGVGGLYRNDASKLAPFTNYVSTSQTGEVNVDILAPGYVYAAGISGTENSPSHSYNNTQGTSFSSPIVAAAACLWKQKYPNGTPDQFLSELQSTASDIGVYSSKNVPSSMYSGCSDNGPSNISNGRINIGNLLGIDDPFIDIAQSSVDISIGEQKQIDIVSSIGNVTYSIANTNIATVSNSGLVTGVASGTTTLTVTATKNNQTDEVTIPVTVSAGIACNSITVNPSSIELEIGDTYEIAPTLTVSPSNADRIFMFASDDDSICTVDFYTGEITAVGEGTTTIEIMAASGNGYAELEVTVASPSIVPGSQRITARTASTYYQSGDIYFNTGTTQVTTTCSAFDVSWDKNTSSNSISNSYDEMRVYAAHSMTFTPKTNYTITSIVATCDSTGYAAGLNTATFTNCSSSLSGQVVTLTPTSGTTAMSFRVSSQVRINYMVVNYTYDSSSPTPTVSGVTISPSSLSLDLNGTTVGNLSATVNGTNSPAQTVTWNSSDTNVATVSNGTVTAIAVGTTTITATSTVDTSKSGSCTVTVTDSTPKTLSSISISGQTTSLPINSAFSFGGTVTAHYSDSSSADVTNSASFTGYNMSVAGQYTVTVSYTYEGTTKTTSYQLTVTSGSTPSESGTVTYTVTGKSSASTSGTAPTGSTVSFNNNGSNNNDQMTNGKKETWTLTGYSGYSITSLKARLHKNSSSGSGTVSLTNDGDSVTLPKTTYSSSDLTASYKEYELLSDAFECEGTIVLTLTSTANSFWCDGIIVSYESIDTSDKIINSLSASYSGGNIFIGGSLDTSKVTVTATFTDSSKYPNVTLKSSDYSLSEISTATAGNKTVTVTYTGSLATSSDPSPLTTTFDVLVKVDEIDSISITSTISVASPGQTIRKSNLTLNATYESGAVTHPTDFEFSDYMFTYSDAPSGGSSKVKTFVINYAGKSTSFDVSVSRTNYVTPTTTTKEMTGTKGKNAGITGTGESSKASYDSLVIEGITCSATNIYVYSGYFSFGKGTGEIHNAVALSAPISVLNISGRQSGARTDELLQVSVDGSSWVNLNSANLNTTNYYFFKISTTSSSSNYSNFNFNVVLKGTDTALNVANYVMYEDTVNQCTSKTNVVLFYFGNMTSSERSTFMNSSDYVIATARERLLAWLANQNKTITYSGGDYIVSSNSKINLLQDMYNEDSNVIILVVALSILSLTSVMLVLKKKRHN